MDNLGQNQFSALVDKFTKQGLTRSEARDKARRATQPKLTPPPGTRQQPRK